MKPCQRILITGASGFIGSALTKALLQAGLHVRLASRTRPVDLDALGCLATSAEWIPLPDLAGPVDWAPALEGMDAVVHLAGMAHRFESEVASDWGLYDRVNHLATKSLVSALQHHPSVTRFLFMSTSRVHGDVVDFPLRADSPLAPVTPYDRSKAAAEAAVASILGLTPICIRGGPPVRFAHYVPPGPPTSWSGDPPMRSIAWAILRPVVVYGPGNRGNMARLEGLLRRGLPVPVGRTANRRSFLFIDNLISAIQAYLLHPDPPTGRAWIVADDDVVSTETLVRAMAAAMGVSARVVHLPEWVLGATAKMGDLCKRLGLPAPWNSEIRGKLLGDFYVDGESIKQELGWRAPHRMEEGIRRTFRG